MAVQLVHRAAQISGSGVDGRLVVQLAQQAEQHPHSAGEQLALERGQHAALEDVARFRSVQDLLLRQHVPLPGQGPAQDEVRGDVVVITGLHHKGQARFPNAVFIVAQQGLGDSQIPCGSSLGDAPLLPQQGQGP